MEEKIIVWEGKSYKKCKASANAVGYFCGNTKDACACAFFQDTRACNAHSECLDKHIYYQEIK